MGKLYKYAQHFVKLELMKARFEVFQNESANKGVEFIVKTSTGVYHELYLQTINLEKDRSVKIIKQEIGEPKDTLWLALVLFMKEMEPVLYLIAHNIYYFFNGIREYFVVPSKTLAKPDDYIFIENDQSDRFKHLSNWEIKVFTKAIPQLSKYAFANMIKEIS